MLVIEVGIKLNNDFNCTTHDVYFTSENLDGLAEDEMKKKCIVKIRIKEW